MAEVVVARYPWKEVRTIMAKTVVNAYENKAGVERVSILMDREVAQAVAKAKGLPAEISKGLREALGK
jgi:hypothetical protein